MSSSAKSGEESAATALPNKGDLINGRYEVIRWCGEGTMGDVFEAEDRKLGRRVALKFPKPTLSIELFLREARKAQEVTHHNVCRIYDAHDEPGARWRFISMEYLETTLRKKLEGTRLAPAEALGISHQICTGLQAIHAKSLLHQDLKPGNIMIDEFGLVKITDLGMAGSSLVGGTPRYMAPELRADGSSLSVRTDLFSLGLILYELFVQALEIDEEGMPVITPPSEAKPGFDPDLEDLILRCLDDNPSARPHSAVAVARRLEGEKATSKLFNERTREDVRSEEALQNGRSRSPDPEPLRTKIIATIGSYADYSRGIVDLDGTQVSSSEIQSSFPVHRLLARFLEAGVDGLRVSLGNDEPPEDLIKRFSELRAAILTHERIVPFSKKIPVLVDLPGSRVVIDLKNRRVKFNKGDLFTLHLKKKISDADSATLVVGGEPLGQSLDKSLTRSGISQEKYRRLALISSRTRRGADESDAADVENFLGLAAEPMNIFRLLKRNKSLRARVKIWIGDTAILSIEKVTGNGSELRCRVVQAPHKELSGFPEVAFQGIDLDLPSLTDFDRSLVSRLLEEDLADGRDNQVLAFLSVPRTQLADDILSARHYVEQEVMNVLCKVARSELEDSPPMTQRIRWGTPGLIAKIESSKGWRNRSYIMDVADAVLVSRQSLALSADPEWVPEMQKRLIILGNKRGKAVICATQVLQSMVERSEPTRAEFADVFNAIQDGTDAVLLSEETSKGNHPFHAVRKAVQISDRAERYYEFDGLPSLELRQELRRDRILNFLKDDYDRIKFNEGRFGAALRSIAMCRSILRTEGAEVEPSYPVDVDSLDWREQTYGEKWQKTRKQGITNRITESACLLAETEDVSVIVTASTSGRTTRMISRLRPRLITIGAAHDMVNTRKLLVSYGVVPVFIGYIRGGTEELFLECCKAIERSNALLRIVGSRYLIFTSGTKTGKPGTTDTIQFRLLEEYKESMIHSSKLASEAGQAMLSIQVPGSIREPKGPSERSPSEMSTVSAPVDVDIDMPRSRGVCSSERKLER